MMRFYDVFGETLPSMALARAAALAAKGWAVGEVRRRPRLAADQLERQVLPYVPALLDSHRSAGRVLVLATTTPYDLVAPLARTGSGSTRSSPPGTGGWSMPTGSSATTAASRAASCGRSASCRPCGAGLEAPAWTCAQSWAYSDSVYDVPLLRRSGTPRRSTPTTACTPPPSCAAGRWCIWTARPACPRCWAPSRWTCCGCCSSRPRIPYARFDIAGTENIPRRGPAIVAANHRSYFDLIAYGLAVFEAGRNPRGMAKKEMFDAPVIGTLIRAVGRHLRRPQEVGPSAPTKKPRQALRNGEVLIIAPQGTIPRGEAFFDPRLHGKRGAARLAAATGAPVIPLGVWGTERVWPRSSRVPNVTNVLHPPTIRVRVGPPVRGLTGTDFDADTETDHGRHHRSVAAEAHLRRIPTADELARTMPAGRTGEP